MELTEVDPADEAAVADFVAVSNASRHASGPPMPDVTARHLRAVMTTGWDGDPVRCFLGRDADGTAVVAASANLPRWDNRGSAWLDADVHPAHRRRGHGSAALAQLEAFCAADGRDVLGAAGWDLPATYAFLGAHGYEQRSLAVNRRMVLADVPRAQVDAAYDEAAGHAGDYDLVRVAGATPPELVDRLVVAVGAINDAPLDDLVTEADVFSPERLAAYESAQEAAGQRLYRLLAVHRETGVIGGHSDVVVDGEDPTWADQHDTSVVREHRGRRLGLLLKAGMVRWLAEVEPQVATISTWNAESNEPMVAVNERLGYVVHGRAPNFQRQR